MDPGSLSKCEWQQGWAETASLFIYSVFDSYWGSCSDQAIEAYLQASKLWATCWALLAGIEVGQHMPQVAFLPYSIVDLKACLLVRRYGRANIIASLTRIDSAHSSSIRYRFLVKCHIFRYPTSKANISPPKRCGLNIAFYSWHVISSYVQLYTRDMSWLLYHMDIDRPLTKSLSFPFIVRIIHIILRS